MRLSFFCAFHFKICSCSFACICFLWVCVFCHTMPCDWVERHHFGNSRTRLCKHLEKNFPPGTQVSPLLFTLLLLLLLLCTICMLLLWCFCFDCAQAQDQAHFSWVNCWLHSFFSLSHYIICIRYRIWGKISGTCAFAYVCLCLCLWQTIEYDNMFKQLLFTRNSLLAVHTLFFFYFVARQTCFISNQKKQ